MSEQNPLDEVMKLHAKIGNKLEYLGLEIDSDFSIQPSDEQNLITFKLNILPGAFITESDFDDEKYNQMFEDIVGEL